MEPHNGVLSKILIRKTILKNEYSSENGKIAYT